MVNSWLNIWVSYMWTAVEETKIEAILAVMNNTQLAVKLRPEKIQVPMKFEPMTSEILMLLYSFFFLIFFICTFLWQIIDKPPIKSIATSPKWFTSPATSFPCICQFSLTVFGHLKKTAALEEVLGVREVPCPKTQQNYPDFSLNHTLR